MADNTTTLYLYNGALIGSNDPNNSYVLDCCYCREQSEPTEWSVNTKVFANIIDISIPNRTFDFIHTAEDDANQYDQLIEVLGILTNNQHQNGITIKVVLQEEYKANMLMELGVYQTDDMTKHIGTQTYPTNNNSINLNIYKQKMFWTSDESYPYLYTSTSPNSWSTLPNFQRYKNYNDFSHSISISQNDIGKRIYECSYSNTNDFSDGTITQTAEPVFKCKTFKSIPDGNSTTTGIINNLPIYTKNEYYLDRILTGVTSGYQIGKYISTQEGYKFNAEYYCTPPKNNKLYFIEGHYELHPVIKKDENHYIFYNNSTTITGEVIQNYFTSSYIWNIHHNSIPANASTYIDDTLTKLTDDESVNINVNYYYGNQIFDIYDDGKVAVGATESQSNPRPLSTVLATSQFVANTVSLPADIFGPYQVEENGTIIQEVGRITEENTDNNLVEYDSNNNIYTCNGKRLILNSQLSTINEWRWVPCVNEIPPSTWAKMTDTGDSVMVSVTQGSSIHLTFKYKCGNIELTNGTEIIVRINDIITYDLSTQFSFNSSLMTYLPEDSKVYIDDEWQDIYYGKYYTQQWDEISDGSLISTLYPCFIVENEIEDVLESGLYVVKPHHNKYSIISGSNKPNFKYGVSDDVSGMEVIEQDNDLILKWDKQYPCSIGWFTSHSYYGSLYKLESSTANTWTLNIINNNSYADPTTMRQILTGVNQPPYWYGGPTDIFSTYYTTLDNIYSRIDGDLYGYIFRKNVVNDNLESIPNKTYYQKLTRVALTTDEAKSVTNVQTLYFCDNYRLIPNETQLSTRTATLTIQTFDPATMTSLNPHTEMYDTDEQDWFDLGIDDNTTLPIQYNFSDLNIAANTIFFSSNEAYVWDDIPRQNADPLTLTGNIGILGQIYIDQDGEYQTRFITITLQSNQSIIFFRDGNNDGCYQIKREVTINQQTQIQTDDIVKFYYFDNIYVLSGDTFNMHYNTTTLPSHTHYYDDQEKEVIDLNNSEDIEVGEITYSIYNDQYQLIPQETQFRLYTYTYNTTTFTPSITSLQPNTSADVNIWTLLSGNDLKYNVIKQNNTYTCKGIELIPNSNLYTIMISGNSLYNKLSAIDLMELETSNNWYILIYKHYYDQTFGSYINEYNLQSKEYCIPQIQKIYDAYCNGLDSLWLERYQVYYQSEDYINDARGDTDAEKENDAERIKNTPISDVVSTCDIGILYRTTYFNNRNKYMYSNFGVHNTMSVNYHLIENHTQLIRFNIDTTIHPEYANAVGVKCIVMTSFFYPTDSTSELKCSPGIRDYGYITGVMEFNTFYDFGITPFTYSTYTNANVGKFTSNSDPTLIELMDLLNRGTAGNPNYRFIRTFCLVRPIELVTTGDSSFSAFKAPKSVNDLFDELNYEFSFSPVSFNERWRGYT